MGAVRRSVPFVLVVLLAPFAAVVPDVAADDAPGPTLDAACEDAELSDRTCASVHAAPVLVGSLCADVGVPATTCADATDGVAVEPSRLDAFEQSWVHRALRLQSRLDEAEPLRNSLWPHTHNSYNSTAYEPTLSGLDPNQRWSILDQLRMGIRAIELDLHPSPARDGIVLCHGRQVPAGVTTVHAGCSTDRPLRAGLDELRAFLDLSGNEREVVVLYLENQLEGDPAFHDMVADDLAAALGDLAARPPDDQACADMPLDRSRADLLTDGDRVLIVGNCGPDGWGSWVHQRGPQWLERSLGEGYAAYPDCIGVERDAIGYDANWVRVYEDATWLSAMVDARYRPQTPDDVRNMVRCGVDMIGFDRIDPGDGRLEALVWSWAVDEPDTDPARACVAWGGDARFFAAACGEERSFACRTAAGAWVVPPAVGPVAQSEAACATVGAVPATPPTGWENERLRDAASVAAAGELWLSIANPSA